MDFITKNIKNKVYKDYNYQIYKIKYSDLEIKTLDKFNIQIDKEQTEFSHYGDLKSLHIFDFLSSIGENEKESINIIEKIIKKICKTTISGFDKKYFWLSIRISNPNNFFDIPRWHRDGKYFMEEELKQPKLITTLKGPGTLLIEANDEASDILTEHEKTLWNNISHLDQNEKFKIIAGDENKKNLDNKLKKINKAQLQNKEALLFYSNDLIHSEPKMNKQRIFISVLPGNKNQIETLKEKRYPNKTNQKGGDTSNTYFSKYLIYKQKYIRLKKLLNL